MASDDPVLLTLVAYHQRWNRDERPAPALLARDVGSQPHLHVEDAERGLHVPDRGLDLDRQQEAGRGMEGEDVVATAFPEVVEAGFNGNVPVQPTKHARDRVLQLGVTGVHQAIECLALPRQVWIEPGAQRRRDPDESTEWDLLPSAILDQPNHLPRHLGKSREIALPQAKAKPESPVSGTQGEPHAPMMDRNDYQPITARLFGLPAAFGRIRGRY
jgi:hypothetical protein